MNKKIILSFLLLSSSILPSFAGGVLSKMAREGSEDSKRNDRKVQELQQKLNSLRQFQQELSSLQQLQQELSSLKKIEPELSGSKQKKVIKPRQNDIQEVFPHVSSLQSSVLSATSPFLIEYEELNETNHSMVCFPDSVGHKFIEEIHRHAFHEMNAILSRFMDDRHVLREAIKNHSRVFKFFAFQAIQNTISDRTTVFFPLTHITDPLASCLQGLVLIKTNETWSDLFLLMKNTIFGENNLSSFSHEAGVFVRTHIEQSLFALSQNLRHGQGVQGILNLLTPDTLQVYESQDPHSALALDIFKDIGETIYGSLNTLLEALPSDRIEVIEMVSDGKGGQKIIRTQSKKASDAEIESLVHEYSNKINPLWKAHERVRRTLVELSKRALIDAFHSSKDQSLEMLKISGIVQMALKDEATIGSYDDIMGRLMIECDNLETCRIEVGLRPRKDHRFFVEAIHASQEKDKQDLANQVIVSSEIKDDVLISTEGVENANSPETEVESQNDSPKDILTVLHDSLEIKPSSAAEYTSGAASSSAAEDFSGASSSSVQDAEEKIDDEDDMFSHMYTVDYIKEQHAKFQALKKAQAEEDSKSASKRREKSAVEFSSSSSVIEEHDLKEQEVREAFRFDLYTFLNDEIFHPVHRPTWQSLIGSLASFGFKGEVNHNGTGSVWKFTVNEKNKLFWGDKNYQDAFFNVHEYKGSGPIHPAYLKFFKTGLSNVFGISKEHVQHVLSYYKADRDDV